MTVFQVSCPECIQTAESLRQEAALSSLYILVAFTSGADALGGSLASLSLELLSVSESEELSESLVLPDSGLLECADATRLGWDCRALQCHHEIKLESSMGEGYLLIILTWQDSKLKLKPCVLALRGEGRRPKEYIAIVKR